MTKFKVIDKKPSKMAILAENAYFLPPQGGQKGVKMNFWEKSKNVTLLQSLIPSYMQKNQKNLSRGFPGKQGERVRKTETDPNIRVLRTLSLSRQIKKI